MISNIYQFPVTIRRMDTGQGSSLGTKSVTFPDFTIGIFCAYPFILYEVATNGAIKKIEKRGATVDRTILFEAQR